MTAGTAHPTATAATAPPSRTGRLLTAGAVAGPLFIAVALLQAVTRDGFDWSRHPTSMLALGDFGWIQVTNFAVAAALFFTAAIGIRHTLRGRPGGKWAPRLVGTFAVALLIAGVFPTDAGMGFPAGAPEGFPDLSWHGMVHALGPTVGINALFVSFFVLARHFRRTRQVAWAGASVLVGVVCIGLGLTVNLTGTGEIGNEFNFLPLWFAMMTGWSWISLLCWKLRRDLSADGRRG